jgi:hypothetical protein
LVVIVIIFPIIAIRWIIIVVIPIIRIIVVIPIVRIVIIVSVRVVIVISIIRIVVAISVIRIVIAIIVAPAPVWIISTYRESYTPARTWIVVGRGIIASPCP